MAGPDFSDELIAILRRGFESKDLDYKGPMSWDENKETCCAIVKDILGMANTSGGNIVFGVSELDSGFFWDGLSSEQCGTFDTTRLNRFLQNYADPPINVLLRKVPFDGKTFVIIEVPPFPDTPHICQKDYPKVLAAATLYVRTDNNETAPIRSSADFRIVLERALRNRRDALLASFRSILTSGVVPVPEAPAEQFRTQRAQAAARFEEINPLKNKPCAGFFEASFFPGRFEQSRFTLEQLLSAARRGDVDFKGWPFLYMHPNTMESTHVIEDGLETFVTMKDLRNYDLVDFWRFNQSGFFYQRTAMRPDSGTDRDGAIICALDFRAAAIYIAEAIHCLTRLYDGMLDDADDVSFVVALLDTQDRHLGGGTLSFYHNYVCRIPEVRIERRRPISEWRAGIVDHAVEIAKDVYQRFNWINPNVGAARTTIEKLFARTL